MTLTTIQASLKASLEGHTAADYHDFVLADGTIWAFSRIYHKQENYNWGQRVAHKGGYAVGFDTKTNAWGKPIEFEALYGEENSDEVFFEFGGSVFLLVISGFKEIAAHGLWKWTGSNWVKAEMKVPAPLVLHKDNINVKVCIVDSSSTTDRYLVFSVSQDLRLYKLSISTDSAVLEPVGQIPVQQLQVIAPMATMGVFSGKRILISYMTRGCGYMWNATRFITYSTESGQFDHICIPDPEGQGAVPPFGQSGGGTGHWLSSSGDWIHATGNSRYGMSESRHEGSVWALQKLEGEPVWKNLGLEIPEQFGQAVVFNPTTAELFAVGKESVAKTTF